MSTVQADNYKDRTGGDGSTFAGVNTAKAWVNFDGTGTVAIRSDYNVDSITDNGSGDYTINFTTNLADANYSFASAVGSDTAAGARILSQITDTPSTSSLRVGNYDTTSALNDRNYLCVHIFGGES